MNLLQVAQWAVVDDEPLGKGLEPSSMMEQVRTGQGAADMAKMQWRLHQAARGSSC